MAILWSKVGETKGVDASFRWHDDVGSADAPGTG